MFAPTRTRTRTILLSALALAATALALPSSAPAPALEARTTTPISVEAACNIQHGTSFSAIATGSGCNDWKCQRGGERYGVDLNEWCQGAHGGNARASCKGGVYNWVCDY